MEAKLIKTDQGDYILIDPTKGGYDKGYLLGTSRESDVNKLALKNCQAIANGYDLDELAEDFIRDLFGDNKKEIDLSNGIVISFIKGFQKALSILGDKKFSEEDILKAYNQGEEDCYKSGAVSEKRNKYIQSLQQTEWDCIVEMEEVYDGLDEMAQPQYSKQPKLDADGCLILKRK